ncbi:hypothetical protein, partial [Delftia acidovorans]|uniref:hypothetical protein n=1 Tax=Delftia acidovorans TaxID=80866 RepID=UPI0035A1BA1A
FCFHDVFRSSDECVLGRIADFLMLRHRAGTSARRAGLEARCRVTMAFKTRACSGRSWQI